MVRVIRGQIRAVLQKWDRNSRVYVIQKKAIDVTMKQILPACQLLDSGISDEC
jgi:hypothetical protein